MKHDTDTYKAYTVCVITTVVVVVVIIIIIIIIIIVVVNPKQHSVGLSDLQALVSEPVICGSIIEIADLDSGPIFSRIALLRRPDLSVRPDDAPRMR